MLLACNSKKGSRMVLQSCDNGKHRSKHLLNVCMKTELFTARADSTVYSTIYVWLSNTYSTVQYIGTVYLTQKPDMYCYFSSNHVVGLDFMRIFRLCLE